MFESASALKADTVDSGGSALWGLTLLNLGRATGDRPVLRQAVEKLRASTDKEPSRPDTLYNLACAYALIAETGQAVRYLRDCFARDPEKSYFIAAQKDTDFKSLRGAADFQKLFESDTR